jgi:transcription elongation factor Elf1
MTPTNTAAVILQRGINMCLHEKFFISEVYKGGDDGMNTYMCCCKECGKMVYFRSNPATYIINAGFAWKEMCADDLHNHVSDGKDEED